MESYQSSDDIGSGRGSCSPQEAMLDFMTVVISIVQVSLQRIFPNIVNFIIILLAHKIRSTIESSIIISGVNVGNDCHIKHQQQQ